MPDLFIERLEALHERPLTDEEKFEVELWQKGRKLRQIVGLEGWEIAVDTLRSFAVTSMDTLMSIPPGDPRVEAAHAVAYGANETFVKFQQAIANALRASQQPPVVLQEGYKQATAMPIESM